MSAEQPGEGIETAGDPLIGELREQITSVDRELLAAVNRRIEIVRRLHDHKQAHGMPLRDPSRESSLLDGLAAETRRSRSPEQGLRQLLGYLLDLTRRELHGVEGAVLEGAARGRAAVARSIVCLPGDGIGPEVMGQALQAIAALPLELELAEYALGGAAIDACGDPLPATTLEACRAADAVLLGAVGGPRWDGGALRPEQGLIGLRKALDVYANLRPALGEGVDLVIVRELVGGLYYGSRGTRADGTVFDTCEYHPRQVERIARRAFAIARGRAGRLVSVDKANVLDTSRMWRRVVGEVAAEFPDVELRHALVDSVGMQLVMTPGSFDVLVTENTFGDILSDVAAGVTGGLGLAASASLGDGGPGIFEPVHGSAPDIAGAGIANPAGMLRSLALALEHGLGEPELARLIEAAVASALDSAPTADLGGEASTAEFGAVVVDELRHGIAA